jgi:II/X family phage/plasmid replication protein
MGFPAIDPNAESSRLVPFGPDWGAFSSQWRHSFSGAPVIDWVTAVVPCSHPEAIRGGRLMSVTPDGEIEWEVVRPQSLVGSHESSIQVQTWAPELLWVSGNPAKWLQGHNVFGTDDLRGLMRATMVRLSAALRLVPAISDYAAWESGEYELHRVDVTAMWALPRRDDVRAWLRAVEVQARSRHGRALSRGGTVYFGTHSRRWALKFYAKGDELADRGKDHKLSADLERRTDLVEFADNKHRGELTLRRPELVKLRLDRASNWDDETPLRALYDHIKKVQMADQFSLTPDSLEGLAPRLRLVYEAWKGGRDIRQLLPLRTFYRYRKELLAHGVDIGIRQPAQSDNVIPLVRALRPQAIAQVPEWAKGTSLYFEPKRGNLGKS